MARPNMSLPHERMKAKLKSRELNLRVKQAEIKQALVETRSQLGAMKPKRTNNGGM